ncbi:MAG: hypothetical protein L0215_07885 [Gemmataceae bacterium]|nr:hypothetical protein [Gemmataceae bacterium]
MKDHLVDGRKLVEQLKHDGFDVTAAAWIKRAEPDKWYLYVASKNVDQDGKIAAYQALNESFHALRDPWINPFRITLISTTDPICTDLLRILAESPEGRRYWGPRLGKVSIAEAFIYPSNDVAAKS